MSYALHTWTCIVRTSSSGITENSNTSRMKNEGSTQRFCGSKIDTNRHLINNFLYNPA